MKKLLKNFYIKKIAKKQLSSNSEAILSLKKYDEGKKTISTTRLEKRMPNIRVATGK